MFGVRCWLIVLVKLLKVNPSVVGSVEFFTLVVCLLEKEKIQASLSHSFLKPS